MSTWRGSYKQRYSYLGTVLVARSLMSGKERWSWWERKTLNWSQLGRNIASSAIQVAALNNLRHNNGGVALAMSSLKLWELQRAGRSAKKVQTCVNRVGRGGNLSGVSPLCFQLPSVPCGQTGAEKISFKLILLSRFSFWCFCWLRASTVPGWVLKFTRKLPEFWHVPSSTAQFSLTHSASVWRLL